MRRTYPTKRRRSKNIYLGKIAILIFKLISAICVGVFLSLLGHAIVGYRAFSFMFIFLTVFFAFFSLVRKLKFVSILLVDVLFIIIIVALKSYIDISISG